MSEDLRPRAYREGVQEFFGREFLVSPDVLIPRPETEAAVEAALSLAGKSYLPGVKAKSSRISEKPKILDVGTGSGCIGITLGLELPEAKISAIDVSKKALKMAQKNAKKLGAPNVEFLESNLLEAYLSAYESSEKMNEKFDIIVSNLPYVDRTWSWLEAPESAGLKFEPGIALYAENGGLELIFELVDEIFKLSWEKPFTKFLILEADPVQHEKITSRAEARGFKLLEVRGFQLVFEAIPYIPQA